MSRKEYDEVIRIAKENGTLFPERCVTREEIASVEKRLDIMFSEQMIDFYTKCGDMTIDGSDVLWLDPHDRDDLTSNLLAVTIQARASGLGKHLIPFFNLCDEGGNIAYFDFSRMESGEPLVTIAYFGEEGFVVTLKTQYDFGEFLLRTVEGTLEYVPQNLHRLSEAEVKGILHNSRTPNDHKKRLIAFYIPSILCVAFVYILFGALFYAMVKANANLLFCGTVCGFPIVGCTAFFTYLLTASARDKSRFRRNIKKIGEDELIKQMTADDARLFAYNKLDFETIIVGTKDYLFIVNDRILPWKKLSHVTVEKHVVSSRDKQYAYDQYSSEKLDHIYRLTYKLDSKRSTHTLIALKEWELNLFIEYLKTKVSHVFWKNSF